MARRRLSVCAGERGPVGSGCANHTQLTACGSRKRSSESERGGGIYPSTSASTLPPSAVSPSSGRGRHLMLGAPRGPGRQDVRRGHGRRQAAATADAAHAHGLTRAPGPLPLGTRTGCTGTLDHDHRHDATHGCDAHYDHACDQGRAGGRVGALVALSVVRVQGCGGLGHNQGVGACWAAHGSHGAICIAAGQGWAGQSRVGQGWEGSLLLLLLLSSLVGMGFVVKDD